MFHLQTSKKILIIKPKKFVGGSSAVPTVFFWAHWYMYQDCDFNKSIGQHTVRHTDKSYGSM